LGTEPQSRLNGGKEIEDQACTEVQERERDENFRKAKKAFCGRLERPLP